jgi:hypothetical protein
VHVDHGTLEAVRQNMHRLYKLVVDQKKNNQQNSVDFADNMNGNRRYATLHWLKKPKVNGDAHVKFHNESHATFHALFANDPAFRFMVGYCSSLQELINTQFARISFWRMNKDFVCISGTPHVKGSPDVIVFQMSTGKLMSYGTPGGDGINEVWTGELKATTVPEGDTLAIVMKRANPKTISSQIVLCSHVPEEYLKSYQRNVDILMRGVDHGMGPAPALTWVESQAKDLVPKQGWQKRTLADVSLDVALDKFTNPMLRGTVTTGMQIPTLDSNTTKEVLNFQYERGAFVVGEAGQKKLDQVVGAWS